MLGHPVDDPARVLELPGQDEMPYEHAGAEDVILVHPVHSHLTEHFQNGRRGDLRVVRRVRVARGGGGEGGFEVRHVDLHEAFEHFERLDALVSGAVPDHRHAQLEAGERLGNRADEVRGGDEAYVMYARVAQPEHYLPQLRHGELHPAAPGDLAVLAVDAAEGAAGEEAAARAAYAGLLGVVRRRPRGAGEIWRAAASQGTVFTLGAAGPRAVCAAAQNSSASLVWP